MQNHFNPVTETKHICYGAGTETTGLGMSVGCWQGILPAKIHPLATAAESMGSNNTMRIGWCDSCEEIQRLFFLTFSNKNKTKQHTTLFFFKVLFGNGRIFITTLIFTPWRATVSDGRITNRVSFNNKAYQNSVEIWFWWKQPHCPY